MSMMLAIMLMLAITAAALTLLFVATRSAPGSAKGLPLVSAPTPDMEAALRQLGQDAQGASYDPGSRALEVRQGPYRCRLQLVNLGKQGFALDAISACVEGALTHGQPPHHARAMSPLSIPYTAPILLRAETSMDRLGKRLGLNREAQTGDDAFDAQIYIETDAPDALVRATLQDAELRQSVQALMRLGFGRVTLFEPRAMIHARQHPIQTSSGQALLALHPQVQRLLTSMTGRLPHVQLPQGARAPMNLAELLWFGLLLSAVAVAIIFGVRYTQHPVLGDELMWTSLGVGTLAWLVALPALVLALRGRSTSFRLFVMWALLLLPLMPLGSSLGARWINASLDPHPTQVHQVQVLRKWRSGKNNTSCNVELRGHREQRQDSLQIECAIYKRLSVGQRVPLRVGPGRLGQPWIKGWGA